MHRIFKYIFILFIIVFSFISGSFFYFLNNNNINFSRLENYNPGRPSILLDDQGNEWARFELDRREPIQLFQMPKHLINAFLAVEDHQFFNHAGISWRGIIRSIVVNAYRGRKVQGASTITQQLTRLLFFDSKKTFERKIKEQFYAIIIERQFTKEQILQTYLNHVYFGCGIYGVQAAAQRFWGKSVQQLTIAQAAILAGIVRSPGNYCPLLYPLSSEKRRNVVLSLMRNHGFISEQDYGTAKNEELNLYCSDTNVLAPHLRESLRLLLEDLVGKKRLYSEGLIIQTTLNKEIQKQADMLFKKQCEKLQTTLQKDIDGALISIETISGEIKALIGGYDYIHSKFNRALQARRQMGSIFKPLIYAAAVQSGMQFSDTEVDEPFEMAQFNGKIWRPNNYNEQFNGQISLAYALSHSNNIVAIKTLLKTGTQPIIDLAKKCHIQGPFHEFPSLALGCVDATLKEVVGMFNVFANNGVYVEPHFIKWIKDQWGNKIFKFTPEKNVVMHASVSSQVAKVLMHSLERIHQMWNGAWLPCQAISKTGTTNDSRICWYAGSTPQLTTALYIGCDNNTSLGKNIYPSKTAFPIWFELNRRVAKNSAEFIFDPSLHEVLIDEKTAQIVSQLEPGIIKILV